MDDPNVPPDDPSALDPSMQLTGKKGSKLPLIIGLVVVAGVIGFFVFRSMQAQNNRKLHAAFMESFADLERTDVGKFWTCILGPNVDARQAGANLGGAITSRFGVDAKNFPQRVREECAPKAMDAKGKVEALTAPPEYAEPLKKYGVALKQLNDAFVAWAKLAPAQVADMEVAKRVEQYGNAWHGFAGGKPDNDVIRYDQFVHCAVPSIDTMKDGQGVVEYLFKECKNPAYPTRVNEECGKMLLSEMPGAPSKLMTKTIAKLAADTRELEAFDDCLRKGRKGKRANDFGEVAAAYNAWMDAGTAVRKIGADALKDK
jgi:hypothetical protein